MSETQQFDRKDLKIMAYKEKVSELEERIVDLRVEVTVLGQQLQETVQALEAVTQSQPEEVSEETPEETEEDDSQE